MFRLLPRPMLVAGARPVPVSRRRMTHEGDTPLQQHTLEQIQRCDSVGPELVGADSPVELSSGEPSPQAVAPSSNAAQRSGRPPWTVNVAIRDFLQHSVPESPCLVVNGAVVISQYRLLQAQMPGVSIYYAVKANPEVVPLLATVGASFDVASRAEIELCLTAGVDPRMISYGNPIKKQNDMIYAYERGVQLFSFDCLPELEALAIAAPASSVMCRIITSGEGADWPLSKKFGCDPDDAVALLARARHLGLTPAGISFHVGSQQRDPGQWEKALGSIANIADSLEHLCPNAVMVNVGGGLPAHYVQKVPPLNEYALSIQEALRQRFRRPPVVAIEPGRYLVGDAGVIRSEVVRIRPATRTDQRRWVYLDIGRFTGLAETEGEAILYPIVTPHDGSPDGPVVLAGPTCDSADILYERTPYRLPLELRAGDFVDILSAGAYTVTYASVGFNGFPPPQTYII